MWKRGERLAYAQQPSLAVVDVCMVDSLTLKKTTKTAFLYQNLKILTLAKNLAAFKKKKGGGELFAQPVEWQCPVSEEPRAPDLKLTDHSTA